MKLLKEKIIPIFPTPIYVNIMRGKELSTLDMEYIKIEGEKKNYQRMQKTEESNPYVYAVPPSEESNPYDTHFFDTKLNNLKEFIEQNIDIYVKEVINPKDKDLNFYITQSWVNVLKPGEGLTMHYHSNSLISGVFYVSVEEGDALIFYDQNLRPVDTIEIEPETHNYWNNRQTDFFIENNLLLLFPSRMKHSTKDNPKRTTDRISIAFNVFVKGTIGNTHGLNELII